MNLPLSPPTFPSIEALASAAAECTRCTLSGTRILPVVYRGAERAEVMFVGDVPGHWENIRGKPFAGPAGDLLNKMIYSMGLKPSQVHITHMVKCRTPDTRRPTHEELSACRSFLDAQIDLVQPKVIVAMGVVAVRELLGVNRFLKARGVWHTHRGIDVMPTHHPTHLLSNQTLARSTWHDLKGVMQKLGRPVKGQGNGPCS